MTDEPSNPMAEDGYRHQIVVAFHDEVELPYVDRVEDHLRSRKLGAWDQLAARFPGVSLNRLYRNLTPERFRDMVQLAAQRTPGYVPHHPLSVFVIDCPLEVDARALVAELARWPAVKRVYLAPRFIPATVDQPEFNPEYINQGHLFAAPQGINAVYAWDQPGGDGADQVGADLEYWYMADHEDLQGQKIQVIGDCSTVATEGKINHGTGTVGVICALNNARGGLGITPNLDKLFFFPYQYPAPHLASQILDAAATLSLSPGPVLLIELQGQDLGLAQLPVEVDYEVQQAIVYATSVGITVIEPAGNEGILLDAYEYLDPSNPSTPPLHVLDRNSLEFRDSGAVMVGACSSTTPHTRKSFSNFGSRVDCYAWGENVLTTRLYPMLWPPGGTQTNDRYWNYNGTSSASAIVAGAALSLQGIAFHAGGRLSPATMRSYLGHQLLGTPIFDNLSNTIGVMPDLQQLADSLITGATVTLLTPTVHFLGGAFAGQLVWSSATFQVNTPKTIHLAIKSSAQPVPPYGVTELGPSITVTSTYGVNVKVRLWFSFTTPDTLGDAPSQEVIVVCQETGQELAIQLTATVKELPYAAIALVLDRSGSMGLPAGDLGVMKIEALRQAVAAFVNIMPTEYDVYAGDAAGIISFSQASKEERPMTYLDQDGNGTLALEQAALNLQVQPSGTTAIGKGLLAAKAMLDGATLDPSYSYTRSIVVFTDGYENVKPYIAEVKSSIDCRVYAIGLGNESQVNTAALTELSESAGGYCLLTGALTPSTEDYFLLTKYFLQILLDLTGQEVAADPCGFILAKQEIRIPFQVSDADFQAEVVLLSDGADLALELETPAGKILSANQPGVRFGRGHDVRFCRLTLPLPMDPPAHAGTWYARLALREAPKGRASVGRGRYSLSVHVRSDLNVDARVSQPSRTPGAPLLLRAALSQYGVPLTSRAEVEALIQRPDGTSTTVPLQRSEPGLFEAAVPAPLAGVYRVHFSADGKTLRGKGFHREKLLTPAILRREDAAPPSETIDPRCCRWIAILLCGIGFLAFCIWLTLMFGQ